MFCIYDREEILELFERYRSSEQPRDGAIIDFFGAIILAECVPYLASRMGTKISSPPYPDDTFRASFIEYVALLDSVRYASPNLYQMCEIGASYAPFSALAGKLALELGVKKIVLKPVEASKRGFDSIQKNLSLNQLLPHADVDIEIINAAVSSRFETLHFPDLDCRADNGGAVSAENVAVDVRGASIRHIPIDAIPLDQIINKCRADEPVDLLHIDIQGAEQTVIPDSLGLLNVRVKRMMIATHSRAIEAELLAALHRNGWDLLAEEPVQFNFRRDLKSFVGMTTKDGSQYWVNSRFQS